MEIANPIYDAVFKFMMEDKKIAALFIGSITGYDVEYVEICRSERKRDWRKRKYWLNLRS